MPKVFVIVVTYRGLFWYEKLFTSLRQSSIPLEVIVVNNDKSDGTKEYLREHFPEVIILEPRENLGFGKGNNLALKYVLNHDCDYVFLLNQDTWLIETNTIEELIRICLAHPDFGVLSPMHLRSDGGGLLMLWEDGNNFCSKQIISDYYGAGINDLYETNYVNAAAWFIPKKTLETIGGFNPIFQHFGEDDDYLNRVLYHGLKIGICPKIKIVHDHQPNVHIPFAKSSRFRHEQDILKRLVNINLHTSVIGDCLSFLKRAVKSFIKIDFKLGNSYLHDFLFVLKNYHKICLSRQINLRKGASWLDSSV